MATYFISRAKTRLQMLNEDHGKAVKVIKKLEAQGTLMRPGRYATFYDYLIEQRDQLEFCIMHFKP